MAAAKTQLATHSPPEAFAYNRCHAEVDQANVALSPRYHDVIELQIPMRNAGCMANGHGINDAPHEIPNKGLLQPSSLDHIEQLAAFDERVHCNQLLR